MFLKLCVFLYLAGCYVSADKLLNWELAVAIDKEINLLQGDGKFVETEAQSAFTRLKALAYDHGRNQFVVSDENGTSDTIYTVQVTKESDVQMRPLIDNLADDVQGIAVDASAGILYWADLSNGTINKFDLKGNSSQSKLVLLLKGQMPRAIAIDVCNGHIYWSNDHHSTPSIERANLDGTEQTVFVKTDIKEPKGLSIDHASGKLYWAEAPNSLSYGQIWSINLDGTNREKVKTLLNNQPYGIAVKNNEVFWTDTTSNSLYKLDRKTGSVSLLRQFEEMPMGLVINSRVDSKECERIKESLEQTSSTEQGTVANRQEDVTEQEVPPSNKPQCFNYCFKGVCGLDLRERPFCNCLAGYEGQRCQTNICDNYCLNDGSCKINLTNKASCECSEGFGGERCEKKTDFSRKGVSDFEKVYSENELCQVYCLGRKKGVYLDKYDELCSCTSNGQFPLEKSHNSSLYLPENVQSTLQSLGDPIYLLSGLLVVSVLTIAALTVYIHLSRNRRPRIKKRIIVNKNVTPLTYRPQATTEQCEITIENCCNMNVCETPCFEPQGFKEDKKMLLSADDY